ncbi:MAG: signal recognition particle protein [Bacilli bacterium]|nr:signal recognition particle protein [Bacilli bacterium]
MPFDSLSERLQMSLRRLTGRGKINENDIDEIMKEVRVALLEADVNYKIVKSFIADIKEKALGERVMKSLTPGDQVLKIVNEELKSLMGEEAVPLNINENGTTVILFAGLQGSGKTTHAGKLANYIRKKYNARPLLIAADVYRPAAVNQLVTLGKQLNVEVFEQGVDVKPQKIVENGLAYAKTKNCNVVIIDTAGRLQIDEKLMDELADIKKIARPNEILLAVDAMTGQDAVNVASSFHEKLGITGCILTKLDSDTRGGAALSIRYMTGIPIKFCGVGEKLDQIEVFHPERMADRILGMGDVMSLIEKATESIDETDAMDLAEKLSKGHFNYNDFLKQLSMIKKMGSLKSILGMIPGMGSQLKNMDIDDKQFDKIEAIISSMTKEERKNPDLVSRSQSRKERIARGSGRGYPEVNALTRQFEDMRTQMKRMMGLDEKQVKQMARTGMPPSNMSRPKKGKGKNKGQFRF